MSKAESKMSPLAVIKSTSSEHGSIVAAQQRVEAALASAALGHEREWTLRVSKELQKLRELLIFHCESVEEAGGLLQEIQNAMLTVNERLVDAREYHPKLLRECDRLIAEVNKCEAGKPVSVGDLRRHAASFMTDLRHHQACEADLIFEAFERDIGSLD